MFKTTYLNSIDLLQPELFKDIIHNKIGAVVIKSGYPKSVCKQLTENILNKMEIGHYHNAPKIGRIGMAFYETINHHKIEEKYFASASIMMNELREVCYPYISPIDLLRVKLDEIFPQGAMLASLSGKKMFAGLIRLFEENSAAEPHQDILKRDAPSSDLAGLLQGQIAFNMYLRTANSGGDLCIWNWEATDTEAEELQHAHESLKYGFNLKNTDKENPDLRIKIEDGDFIFFNSRNVHAVDTINDGDRISVSCFIGYSGDKSPLQLWS